METNAVFQKKNFFGGGVLLDNLNFKYRGIVCVGRGSTKKGGQMIHVTQWIPGMNVLIFINNKKNYIQIQFIKVKINRSQVNIGQVNIFWTGDMEVKNLQTVCRYIYTFIIVRKIDLCNSATIGTLQIIALFRIYNFFKVETN